MRLRTSATSNAAAPLPALKKGANYNHLASRSPADAPAFELILLDFTIIARAQEM